jgi:hypothetical protein
MCIHLHTYQAPFLRQQLLYQHLYKHRTILYYCTLSYARKLTFCVLFKSSYVTGNCEFCCFADQNDKVLLLLNQFITLAQTTPASNSNSSSNIKNMRLISNRVHKNHKFIYFSFPFVVYVAFLFVLPVPELPIHLCVSVCVYVYLHQHTFHSHLVRAAKAYRKIWCASMALVNLPHIGNWNCIIFFYKDFFFTIFKVLPFSVEICIYMLPSDIKFQNSEYTVPGPQSSYQKCRQIFSTV